MRNAALLSLILTASILQAAEGPFFVDGHDPRPEGKQWVPVDAMSDEFDGDQINHNKWQTDPEGNGWGWIGRPPGLFRPENVKVSGGKMNVTVSVLPEPRTIKGSEYLYQGAIVRSNHAGKPGMYFETRMKANATAMSSTFWLMTKGNGPQRQELDIQECIGATSELTEKWARSWDRIFHSNLILTGKAVPEKVQIQKGIATPTPNHERFYIYAGWWKSPDEVQFFLDGEYVYSLKPTVAWDLPKYLQMAIETYDWNPVPAGGELIATGTWEQRTTQYDWVRVWELE